MLEEAFLTINKYKTCLKTSAEKKNFLLLQLEQKESIANEI